MMKDRIAKLELSQRAEFTHESRFAISGAATRGEMMDSCNVKAEEMLFNARMAAQEVRGSDDARRKYAFGVKIEYFFGDLDLNAAYTVRAIRSVIVTRER